MKIPSGKRFLWAGVTLVMLLICLAVLVTQMLPLYLEGRLIPKLAGAFDLEPEQVQVRRLGLWGADLGPIQLSRNGAAAIAVSAIQLDYTPLSLLRGEAAGLTLVGLDVAVQMGPRGLTIAGVKLPASAAQPSGNHGSAFRLDTLIPLTLKRLSIVDSQVRILWHAQRYRVPVEMHLRTERLKSGILAGRAKFSLLETPFLLEARIDQPANQARLALNAKAVSLRRLAAFLPEATDLDVSGTADLDGWCRLGLAPLEFSGLSLTARFENTRLTFDGGRLQTPSAGSHDHRPLLVTLAGERLDDLKWSGAPFEFDGPLKLAVSVLHGKLAVDPQRIALTGALETLVPKQKIVSGMEIANDLPLSWTLTAAQKRGTADDRIDFALDSRSSGPASIVVGGNRLSGRMLQMGVDGHYQGGALDSNTQIHAQGLDLTTPQGRIQVPGATASAIVGTRSAPAGRTAWLSATAKMSRLKATLGTSTVHIPGIALDLSGRTNPRRPWALTGTLRLADGRFEDRVRGVSAEGLTVLLPFAWPAVATAEAGRLELDTIRWKARSMGGLGGILRQTSAGVQMDLRHTSAVIPGMDARVEGRFTPAGAQVKVLVPPYEMGSDLDLGRLVPAAAGILGRARISASAELSLDGHGAAGSGRLKISGGRVHQDAHDLLLEGIDLSVQMDDLLTFKSAPGQHLKVARLVLGDLKSQHLEVDFQLENDHRFLIEQAGLEWCRGRVNTSALRIDSNQADYHLVLYCDRLNLAELLEQLGAAEASGQGSVNGRIPIRFKDGRLSFDNGFLYSTPGQSGTIRLSGTGALLQGLPPGSPQHTQLDIATEALKDYSYQWAKLQLKSEKEILLLKLELDGKPNRLLPFAYNKALGRFVRVTGAGQADFKGISIDLNFRSPLNEILHYKELLHLK